MNSHVTPREKAHLITRLRKASGISSIDCRDALRWCEWNYSSALERLRRQRTGRAADMALLRIEKLEARVATLEALLGPQSAESSGDE